MWEALNIDTPWLEPTGSIINGIAAMNITDNKKIPMANETEKYRVFVTKAIWVIWKARNRRIFDEKETTADELKAKWKEEIRQHLRTEHERIKLKHISRWERAFGDYALLWCRPPVMARLTNKGKDLIILF